MNSPQEKAQEEETIKCTCEVCGVEYEKPLDHKRWNEKYPNVFFKWSLKYCDRHRKEKEIAALESLPNALEALVAYMIASKKHNQSKSK